MFTLGLSEIDLGDHSLAHCHSGLFLIGSTINSTFFFSEVTEWFTQGFSRVLGELDSGPEP